MKVIEKSMYNRAHNKINGVEIKDKRHLRLLILRYPEYARKVLTEFKASAPIEKAASDAR